MSELKKERPPSLNDNDHVNIVESSSEFFFTPHHNMRLYVTAVVVAML